MSVLLVVDGNSIVNRAFYGIRDLHAPDGTPTNALYGMVNILKKHISNLAPDYAAVAFDLHAPTFRHKIYPEYKAGRHEPPPELITQLPLSRDVARAMGFAVLEKEGYEADDILGTVSEMAKNAGVECYILTGDRDSLQLISDGVKVILAGNKEDTVYDRATFCERYGGIDPERFVELKAMMGDSSDNIPGIAGVGEKTALDLLARFGSVENLYRDFEESDLRPKLKDKIRDSKENALLSRVLVEIKKDVPLGITLADLGFKPEGVGREELFMRLGFSKFLTEIKVTKKTPDIAATAADAATLSAALRDVRASCLVDNGKLYISDGEKVYFADATKETLDAFFDADRKVAVYDSKAFFHLTEKIAFPVRADFDIMLAEYVLNSHTGTKTATEIALERLGYTPEGPAETCAAIFECAALMEKDFSKEEEKLFYDIEMPLSFVLAEMENRGFLVDIPGLAEFGKELDRKIADYTEKIYEYAGKEFNINSPKQLGEVLFGEVGLGLPAAKKTKTGYSTGAEVLESLYAAHPIIGLILDYRAAAKLKSTYVDGLTEKADEKGIVRTNFNQNITATGRLSSTEPNLQNIPVRTELGRQMRKYFIAAPGNLLIDADYSQIELRILAAVSGDKNMTDAFVRGVDIHTATAASAFGIAEEFVTPDLRKRAKAVNFGIVYGIGEFSLAKDIGVSRKRAGEYIRAYLDAYPGVRRYLESSVENAKRDGYVTTITGRKRYIPELSSSRKQMQAFGERVAKNSPIQGSAADIIKIAMISVNERLKKECPEAKLILQVHDELIVEAPADEAKRVETILREEMEGAARLSVPLTVDIETAKSWYDAH